jgi:hypothetical protein
MSSGAQADLNIAPAKHKRLTEAAKLCKDFPPHHHAGAGYRRPVPVPSSATRKAKVQGWLIREGVIREAAETYDHTRMLYGAVGTEQPSPYDTDWIVVCPPNQFFEPLRIGYLDIVVKKKEQITRGLSGP